VYRLCVRKKLSLRDKEKPLGMAALQRGSVREKQILYSGYFEAITIFTRWRGTFTHGYRSACLVRILKKLHIDDYDVNRVDCRVGRKTLTQPVNRVRARN